MPSETKKALRIDVRRNVQTLSSPSALRNTHISTTGSGIPHVPGSATALRRVGRVVRPLGYALDAAEVASSVQEDINNGTSRRSVESVASIAGGAGGGWGGGACGAIAGTMICPGPGTVIGGVIGGVFGGIGGSVGAREIANVIGDQVGYDIIEARCRICGRKYQCRKYNREPEDCCENCR